MIGELRRAFLMLLVMTLLTGGVYPLLVTGLAQALFPRQANGNLLVRSGRVAGSALIGQPFDDPGYFWGRLSATAPFPYNAAASSGSNHGPSSDALLDAVRARVAALRAADPDNRAPIPVDLVTASGSGLDPHISPAAARWQVGRVARVRSVDRDTVARLVAAHTRPRQLGFLGEARVDVLELNLALDAASGWPADKVGQSRRDD
jgi:K+-transporting ATPase ATPase C chain